MRTATPRSLTLPRSQRAASRRRGRVFPWWVLAAVALVYAAVAIPSAIVPQRHRVHDPHLADLLRRGPASYFHHFFDPQALLGEVGSLDLELDTLQHLTANQVVVGALPTLPEGDPGFTTEIAERWQIGGSSDNGVLLFIFPADHRVRSEVGYGLEALLPDATMRRILEEGLLPEVRRGDYLAGVNASLQRITEILQQHPARTQRFAGPAPLAYLRRFAADVPGFVQAAADAWLGAPLRGRLMMDLFALAVGAGLVALVFTTGRLGVGFVQASVLAVRLKSWQEAAAAGGALWALLGRVVATLAILLLIISGTTYYFGGSGRFGGASVEMRW